MQINIHFFVSVEFLTQARHMKRTTSFCLATQLSKSKVSGSGFTPYFFTTLGSENSLIGIKAAKELKNYTGNCNFQDSSKKLSKNEHYKSVKSIGKVVSIILRLLFRRRLSSIYNYPRITIS